MPHDLIVDNAGGHLMQHGEIDMVIVGTDRTTASGDVCNKIGTYLKALAAKDLESAEKLGVLELAEEDLSLCEYVCASKTDYSVLLRDMLTTIEKEG